MRCGPRQARISFGEPFCGTYRQKTQTKSPGLRLWPVLRGRTLIFAAAELGACFYVPSRGSLGDVLVHDPQKRHVWGRTVRQTRDSGT